MNHNSKSANNSDLSIPTTLQLHEHLRDSGGISAALNESNEDEEEENMFARFHEVSHGIGRNRMKLDVRYVETDGVPSSRERDAPGQSSIYIPPGNHEQEEYRKATYAKFPSQVPVLPVSLSSAGFYYTGYKDRVKCFSCGMAVENWMVNDDVYDARWHTINCSMARGEEPRNVPSTSNYSSMFRSLMIRNNGSRARQYQPTGATEPDRMARNASGSVIQIEDEIVRDFQQVNIQEIKFGNILSGEHERFLRSLNLKEEVDRRKTFSKWPIYPAPFLPSILAKEGFFYLGNLDRTQCFACFGILRNWGPDDDVRSQHKDHFPNCRLLLVDQQNCGNIPMSDEDRRKADIEYRIRVATLLPSNVVSIIEPPTPTHEQLRQLAITFPCRSPVNPNMSSEAARLATFDVNWPKDRVRATPQQIAKAGFYFLGDGDRVKCWYCNGGVRYWDPNDEPWSEHAKWFPGCEFVIRNKGVDFVRTLAEAHPNLNRPRIPNHISYDIPPGQSATSTALCTNLNIEEVKTMGFSEQEIQRLILRKRSQTGREYVNTQELIEDLLLGNESNPRDMDGIGVSQGEIRGQPLITVNNKRVGGELVETTKKSRTLSPTPNQFANEAQTNVMKTSIQEIKESGKCKNCFQSVADNVCIPCGHISACSECVKEMKKCFICNAKVQTTVKVYRS